MKTFTPKRRKKIYLNIIDSIDSSQGGYNNKICWYLKKYNPPAYGAIWGLWVTTPFPELMLFASDEYENENPNYFNMTFGDDQLRQDILLFCAAMI